MNTVGYHFSVDVVLIFERLKNKISDRIRMVADGLGWLQMWSKHVM